MDKQDKTDRINELQGTKVDIQRYIESWTKSDCERFNKPADWYIYWTNQEAVARSRIMSNELIQTIKTLVFADYHKRISEIDKELATFGIFDNKEEECQKS